MAKKATPVKEATPAEVAAAVKAAAVAAGKKWKEHSDLVRFEASLVVVDSKGVRHDLGTSVVTPRTFSTGSMGFNVNGKLADPSETGQETGNMFQLGLNFIACHSKDRW